MGRCSWVGVAVAVALLAAAGCGGGGIEGKVTGALGEDATCAKVGAMFVAGAQETVYRCDTASRSVFCVVEVADGVADVTSEARALADAGGADLGC